MPVGEWLKVKIATHVFQPLLNRRRPAGPGRALTGFRECQWNDDRTRLTLVCANGRTEIETSGQRTLRLIVFFNDTQATETFDGEYFTYAVTKKDRRPLVLAEDGQALTVTAAGDERGLALRVDKGSLQFEARDNGAVLFTSARASAAGNWVSFRADSPRPERFLGLGQKTGSLLKNGRTWTMWNSDNADIGKKSDPLYQSCPFAIALGETGSAWGLFFDNPHYAQFTLSRADRAGRLDYRAARGPLAVYLLGGPSLREIVRQFSALTGYYRLPPLWALGHHHSRWEANESAARLASIAAGFRERGIPLDALHVDIAYLRGFRCFTWDAARFPDPDGFLRGLRERRIHPVVITDPGLKKDDDWDTYRTGQAEGFFLTTPAGAVAHAPVWPGPSAFPDFSHPAAARWWGDLFKLHTDKSIDGYWIDMNEPAAFTPRRTLPDNVIHRVAPEEAGGSVSRRDHAALHNYYGFLMAKATAEGLDRLRPGQRTFLFTRSSFAGIQRFASSWTGDNKSNWDHLRLSLPMVMNMGLSGQIMTGPDIGGFWGTPTAELFVRFLQAATFFPFHRNHTASGTPPQEIWHFGKEVEAICAEHIRLRYAFLPYLYTALRDGTVTGDPVCRPLAFNYPDDPGSLSPVFADSQYLCGDDLLATPVLRPRVSARKVRFPKAKADAPRSLPTEWVCHWTHRVYRGGTEEVVAAPLGQLPFFIRKGAVIPAIVPGPAGFVSTAGLHEQSLSFDIFPAAVISGRLYLDDGESLSHRDGEFALLNMSGRSTDSRLTLAVEQSDGRLPSPLAAFAGCLLRVACYGKRLSATRATVNGRALEENEVTTKGDWLIVKLPAAELPLTIDVEMSDGDAHAENRS